MLASGTTDALVRGRAAIAKIGVRPNMEPTASTPSEAKNRLEGAACQVPREVVEVLRTLRAGGHASYLAGGCVRDLVLGRTPNDFDVASAARPEEVSRLFARVVPTGLQHGTVTVVVGESPHTHVEVTTFRGEGAYVDGRRPESVSFIDDVEADLARRDFTINAIAWDPIDNVVVDPFGGVADAARRRVKAVGSAINRFSEDGLRPLRAVRFASVLGFGIARETREAIPLTLGTFRKVASERIRDEFIKLLVNSPRPSRGIELLERTGLLEEFLPELREGRGVAQNRWHRWPVWEHTLRVVDHAPPRLEVRLGALLHDIAKPRCAELNAEGEYSFHKHEHVGADMAREILERLRFSSRTVDAVVHLVKQHNWYYSPGWTDGAVRRHLAKVGTSDEALRDFYALREADIRGHGRNVRSGLRNLDELKRRFELEQERACALTVRDLAIDGRRLMLHLDLRPGPAVGETLRRLLEHVLDHPEDNVESTLLALAATI